MVFVLDSGSRFGSGSRWVAVVERLFFEIYSLGSGSRFGSDSRSVAVAIRLAQPLFFKV